MTDETEVEILGEMDVEEDHGDADWVVYSGGGSAKSGQYIFPLGVGEFCKARGFDALHIPDTPGDIFGLSAEDDRWVPIGKGKSKSSLTTVSKHGETDEQVAQGSSVQRLRSAGPAKVPDA